MPGFYYGLGRALVFIAIALPVSIIDQREFRIPDILSIGGLLLLLGLDAVFAANTLPRGIAAAIMAVLIFILIYIITKGIGLGDIKYAALIGLFCGIPLVFISLLCAAFAGIVYYVLAVFILKRDRKMRIAFGPFMSFGAVCGWLFGQSHAGTLLC